MRAILPFALQAGVGCCAPGELTLALAAELHPVDGEAADRALDSLAGPLGVWRHARPGAQLSACAEVLADHVCADPLHPDGLSLDTALASGFAHPAAGVPLVVDPGEHAVVDGHALTTGDLRWRCGTRTPTCCSA
jgi:hypothetical protein